MPGEIETEKVPKKCPKCGGDMKETGKAFLIDQRDTGTGTIDNEA